MAWAALWVATRAGQASAPAAGEGPEQCQTLTTAAEAYRNGTASKGKCVTDSLKFCQLAGSADHHEADRKSDSAAPADADMRPSNSGA